jgi:hypothetical protein
MAKSAEVITALTHHLTTVSYAIAPHFLMHLSSNKINNKTQQQLSKMLTYCPARWQ